MRTYGPCHSVHLVLKEENSLLYLYLARNKITELSIPTHAQLQRHRLKYIKNHLKNTYMFRSSTIFRELQCPRQSHYYYWPQLDVFMRRVVMWQHLINFNLWRWSCACVGIDNSVILLRARYKYNNTRTKNNLCLKLVFMYASLWRSLGVNMESIMCLNGRR